MLMTKVALFLIFLMLWGQAAAAEVIEQTTFTIEVHENGNAIWTVEKRLPLTASEINEWEGVIKKGQNISRYQNQIKDNLDGLLRSAQNSSNRSMEIENLNISFGTKKTLSGATGVILYSFEWKNFSRMDSGNILIGDTFSEGSVFSLDNKLIIKIPSGFEAQNVSPSFDKREGNSLIWDGTGIRNGTSYQGFSKGEPSLVLTRTVINHDAVPDTLPDTLPTATVLIPAVILISGTLLVVWKRSRSHSRSDNAGLTYNTENEALRTGDIEAGAVPADDVEIGSVKANNSGDKGVQIGDTDAGIVQTDKSIAETAAKIDNESGESQPPFPYLPEEFLGDEEMIERYLTKCGGQAYQSDIVKDSGLSKSKISIVLAKMKDDGKVIKIKKGKENIIRLAVKKE